MDHVLHRKSDCVLPEHTSASKLAGTFNKFFLDKINNIRSKLDTYDQADNFLDPKLPQSLNSFSCVTEADIKKIVQDSPSKSCGLDLIPTSLLKTLIEPLAPVLTKIVNLSLQGGVVPDTLKSAIATPLIKKQSLDPDVLKNYRPVSNLSYISKVIEKELSKQLNEYLTINDLMEPRQSAYRKHHSTETTLATGSSK